MNSANLTGGANTIKFAIDTSNAVETIYPITALPTITNQLTIDGSTEGSSSTPLIVIDGSEVITGVTNGLTINASRVFINDIAISSFSGNGIRIGNSGSQTKIYKCFIGTNSLGDLAMPNLGDGILVNGASNLLIGNTNPGVGSNGNVISGNGGAGISMIGGADNNILGNQIGTDSSGSVAIGNAGDGISIDNGSFDNIGGETTGMPNGIAGNGGNGITLTGGSHNNAILGNYIGVNGSGNGFSGESGDMIAIPNKGSGIIMDGSPDNSVGDTQRGGGNYISGNGSPQGMNGGGTGYGIGIENGSTGELIVSNVIGANLRNMGGIGNYDAGIYIAGGSNTTIGGTVSGAGNTISFNGAGANMASGITIVSGTNIPILSNTIGGNGALGIDLGDNFFTKNDSLGHSGPNNYQNFPVLTSAGTAAGLTKIQGTFNSLPVNQASNTYTLQFYANTTLPFSNYGQGQLLIGTTQVTTDANGFAPISVTLPNPTAIGSYVSATATDSNGNTSEFSFDEQVVAAKVTDTAVKITATPSPATVGSPLIYTITATNNGPLAATNVQLNAALDPSKFASAQVSSVSKGGTTANLGNDVFTATFASLASGATGTFTITAIPSVVGKVSTTASVVSNEIDTVTSNNSATSSLSVDIPTDLSVMTQASSIPTNTTVGSTFSIVFIAINNGPGPSSGTVMNIQLPAGVTFVSAASGGGPTPSYDYLTGIVTANLGGLADTGVSAVRLTVAAPAAVPAGGTISFVANISSDQSDPDETNNTATAVVPIFAASDLALAVTPEPNPVLVGGNLTYNYSVTNNGPIADTNVVFTDQVPNSSVANFLAAPNPSQGTASYSNGVVTANLGTLAIGQTVTGTIVIQPIAPVIITNNASVTGDNIDLVAANNSVVTSTMVSPADLSVSIGASPDPVQVNHNLTYTVIVTNNGPANATNVSLVNTLPLGATFISATGPQGVAGANGGTVALNLGTITSGSSVPVTIVVQPTQSVVLTDTASVSADNVDPNTSNNSASVSTDVSPVDLSVGLVASANSVIALNPITFTAAVTNAGPNAATNVTFGDALPAGFTVLSATSSQGSVFIGTGVVGASIGDLAPGGSATVTIVAQPTITGNYLNSASATSDQIDTNPTNNTAGVAVGVTNAPGVFQFSSPNYTAQENGGLVVLTVNRSAGNLGAVNVNYATADGTAVAGVNYKTSTGILTFAAGQTSATITIPIIDAGIINGNTAFSVTLSNATGGGVHRRRFVQHGHDPADRLQHDRPVGHQRPGPGQCQGGHGRDGELQRGAEPGHGHPCLELHPARAVGQERQGAAGRGALPHAHLRLVDPHRHHHRLPGLARERVLPARDQRGGGHRAGRPEREPAPGLRDGRERDQLHRHVRPGDQAPVPGRQRQFRDPPDHQRRLSGPVPDHQRPGRHAHGQRREQPPQRAQRERPQALAVRDRPDLVHRDRRGRIRHHQVAAPHPAVLRGHGHGLGLGHGQQHDDRFQHDADQQERGPSAVGDEGREGHREVVRPFPGPQGPPLIPARSAPRRHQSRRRADRSRLLP